MTLAFTGGILQWNAGNVAGNVTNAGTLTISGTSTLGLSGTLTNTETIFDTGTGTISCATGTQINNEQGATFNFQADASLENSNGATSTSFTNAGILEKSAGTGSSTISLPVTNTGSIAGDSGTLQLTGGGSGSGTDTINATMPGTVALSGSFSGTFAGSGSGAVDLSSNGLVFTGTGASGVTLAFTGGVLQWNAGNVAGNVTNAGTLTISGSSTLGLSGTLTNTDTILDSSTGTVSANTGTMITNEQGATFNFQADASLENSNGATGTSFTNAGILEKSAGIGSSTISLPVTNTGSIAGNSGTLQLTGGGNGSGTDTINATMPGTVALSGSFSGTFGGSGSGAVELSSNDLPAFTGAVASGATLAFTGNVLQWNAGNVGGNVTNAGTLTISGTSTLGLSGTLTNTETILDTSTGTVSANTGTMITNEPGATFNFQADANLNNANGATGTLFTNAGILEESAGTGSSTISLPVTNTGTITVNSGTLALSGGESGSGTVQINNSATLSDSSGNLEFDGSQYLAMSSSSTLDVAGDLIGSTTNIADFSPAGTVVLDGSGSASTPQTLEAMSQDLGNVAQGFQNNFDYGTLSLASGTYVELVDNAQNVPSAGSQPDAVYCNELIVPSGCTLNLNGLHLYYHQAQINGTLLGADPTVTMTSPTNGLDTNDNLPTLAATAVDNSGSGLASVKFLLSANGGSASARGGPRNLRTLQLHLLDRAR